MVAKMQQPLTVTGLRDAEADWLEFLTISQDDSLGSNFKNIKVSTMILWGESDNITPTWQGKELQKLIPNSQLKIIPGAGHIPYIENTKNFNEILLKFLENKNPNSNKLQLRTCLRSLLICEIIFHKFITS